MHSGLKLMSSALCLLCVLLQLYWGGQDQQGRFHGEYLWADGNVRMSLFIVGPYILLALSSLVASRRTANSAFALIVIFCSIGILAGWLDHDEYMRTPPGRETQPMLVFLAALVLWIGSAILFLFLSITRFMRREA